MLPDEHDHNRLMVDEQGFVVADGVKLGKLATLPGGGKALEVCDKDPCRSAQRGTRLVQIPLTEFSDLENKKPE